MRRFQVLDRQTQIFGRFFLEASAGTGKTFAIEHIAVRALLESSDPVTIDQILIVTFTRAATRELKVRLRTNLTKTLLYLESRSGPDYLQPIFARGEVAIFSAKRKIEEALCNFDAAAIFTLHGFCHKMLTEYAFEAGTFFEISSPDSGAHSQMLFQVVEDFFRAGITRDKYSPSQIEGIVKSSSYGIQGLCKKIVSLVGKALFIPRSLDFSQTLLQFQKNLKLLAEKYSVNLDLFEADISQILSCYKGVHPLAAYQLLQLGSFLQGIECGYDELDQIIGSKDYVLTLFTEDNLKKGKNPKTLSLHYPTLFFDLTDHLTPLIKEATHVDKNFLRIVDDCMQKWKESIYYEESFSPDDLLRKMADALKKHALKEKISEKYHVAIIDEFQDTDPLQWEIFKRLFIGQDLPTKTIYLVGDPKQSIYAFRNADVYTYLEAMHTLGEENRLFLDTNFRSEPSLVKALNALFTSHICNEWMQLPSLGKSLQVRPVSAKSPFPEVEEKTERASVHFFVAEGASGRSRKWPTEQVEDHSLFPFIVSEIHRMTKKEGYRFGQFAILVRDRFQASRLESFLKAWQVPCSVKRSFPIEESIAYLGLHDVIRAVMSPDDVGALKRVLGGVFIGMNAHSLMGGIDLEPLQRARLYFQQARFLIAKKGWGAFFTHFLAEKWDGSENTVLEELLSRKDTSLYFEIRQLMQILLTAPGSLMYSLDGFYAFYKDLAHLGSDDELLKVASESEEDEVIIMTIHASKGLEFDIVFALGLVCRSTSLEDLLRTKVEGKETLETWDLSRDTCIQSVLETDAEKMRHLYVALTRAKTRVYVPVAIDTDRKRISLSQSSPIDLLCQSFGKQSFDLLKAYQSIHEFTVENLVQHISLLAESASVGYSLISKEDICLMASLQEAPEKKLIFSEPFFPIFPPKSTLSFTSLHSLSKVERSPIERTAIAEEEIKNDILPLGAVTGTFLHRILELTLKEELHHPYKELPIKELIISHAMAHSLQGWEDELYSLVKETLFAPLQGKGGTFCIADVPAKQLFLEMEFAFEHHGHMMKGFIDGVFMWENKYYILDWKTNYLGSAQPYTLQNMEKAMEEQEYFLQAAIYAEALKRYLSQFEKRSFTSCFGGAIYIFMRGNGVYHFMPDLSLLLNLQAEETALC